MYLTCRLFLVLVHRTFILAGVLIGGAFAFKYIENRERSDIEEKIDLKQSAYICYAMLTTIGFGGFVEPRTDIGKVLTILYGFVGIPIMLFTLGAYASFMNHCIRKLIISLEFCCCKCWQGKRMYLKTFFILFILLVAEICSLPLYVKWMKPSHTYLQAVYVWFVTITTLGMGKVQNPYPIEDSLPEALGFFGVHFFCLITLTALYQAVQGMIESINNNRRSICAIMFCCYSNDKRDDYDFKDSNHSQHRYSETNA